MTFTKNTTRLLCISICLLIFSCVRDAEKTKTRVAKKSLNNELAKDNGVHWTGTINNKIPVSLVYTLKDSLITGSITYLNTTKKEPIKIIGTLEEGDYRLLEFEKSGNITGILSGTPTSDSFVGTWFSPKSRKDLPFSLKLSESAKTHIKDSSIGNTVFGKYTYQYGEDGPTGSLTITDLGDNKAAFSINSVTGEPAYNLADLPTDTIEFHGNTFTYPLPDSDNCEIKVSFYPGFAFVKYTKGPCEGYFGHNATVEGVFLKVK